MKIDLTPQQISNLVDYLEHMVETCNDGELKFYEEFLKKISEAK